jgi:hypothetical protein
MTKSSRRRSIFAWLASQIFVIVLSARPSRGFVHTRPIYEAMESCTSIASEGRRGYHSSVFKQFAQLTRRSRSILKAKPDEAEQDVAPLFAPSDDNQQSQMEGRAVLDVTLSGHKPLGCTAEESLAPYTFDSNGEESLIKEKAFPVFIQKVLDGGNADQAGLQVGDVIVGVTGVFDQLQDVSYAGLDKVV